MMECPQSHVVLCLAVHKSFFNAISPNHREPERCFSFITISMSRVRRDFYQIEDGLPEK